MSYNKDWESNRQELIRRVEAHVLRACTSNEIIHRVEAEVLIANGVTGSPLLTARREQLQINARAARFHGRFYNADYQNELKGVLWKYWLISREMPGADIRYQSLHRFYYPYEGVQNFLNYRPYVFVRPVLQAGTTAIFYGEKGGGKTHRMCWSFAELWKMKDEQLRYREQGRESQCELALQRTGAGWKVPKKIGDSEESADSAPAEEEGARAAAEDADIHKGRTREKFGFYTAKHVRFVTNIAFRKRSPLLDYIDHVSLLSDMVLKLGDHDVAGYITFVGFDEAGTLDEKQRSMTAAAWVIRLLHSQIRKYNGVFFVSAQSKKHQLREQVIEESDMEVVCHRPEGRRWKASYTIPGVFQNQEFINVSDTDLDFISRHKTVIQVDVRLDFAWEVGEAHRRAALQDDQDWTHEQDIKVVNEWILRNRTSEARLQAGKNPVREGEIQYRLENYHKHGVYPTVDEFCKRHPNLADRPDLVKEVMEMVRDREEQEKKGRDSGKLPRYKTDPDAVVPT